MEWLDGPLRAMQRWAEVMRGLTNVVLLVIALVMVVGTYVLRDQSFAGVHGGLGTWFGTDRQHVAKPHPALPGPLLSKAVRPKRTGSRDVWPDRDVWPVEVTVSVLPVAPKPSIDLVSIGMEKNRLWTNFGQPDVITSFRDRERLRETYMYLVEDRATAVVIRLVNSRVISVSNSRTISPPLLVPLTSRSMVPTYLTSERSQAN